MTTLVGKRAPNSRSVPPPGAPNMVTRGHNGAMTSEGPDPDATDVVEANKRKMREALQAKQRRLGEDHIDTDPKQSQAHGPVEQKRTFRRKTG